MNQEAMEKGEEQLALAKEKLALAIDLQSVMDIVRRTARELTGADGATFIIRDQDFCFYAEEYAISPLWKGYRFPIRHCISGWAMLHKQHVVVEDIYADNRIPHDAYKPTFVKSLAIVPIDINNPIGAIGNYWATHHLTTTNEIYLLEKLAAITAPEMLRVMQTD